MKRDAETRRRGDAGKEKRFVTMPFPRRVAVSSKGHSVVDIHKEEINTETPQARREHREVSVPLCLCVYLSSFFVELNGPGVAMICVAFRIV